MMLEVEPIYLEELRDYDIVYDCPDGTVSRTSRVCHRFAQIRWLTSKPEIHPWCGDSGGPQSFKAGDTEHVVLKEYHDLNDFGEIRWRAAPESLGVWRLVDGLHGSHTVHPEDFEEIN